MDDSRPTDEELLRRIGLSDSELRDMQAKYLHFAESLTPSQRQSLRESAPAAAEAAATLGPDVTPERLEQFITSRAVAPGAVVFRNRTGEAGE